MEYPPVNTVDMILLAILFLFALRGYFKGLFREIFSLAGLAAGFVLASRYDERVAALLAENWKNSFIILRAASFVMIFFVVYFCFNIVGWLLHRSSSVIFLQGINRIGGVVVGAGKGAALSGIAILFLASTPLLPSKTQDRLGRSYLVPAFERFAQQLVSFGRSKLLDAAEPPSQERNAAMVRRGA
ncbi:MAG TPA: CvpA family protein [Verrucomicrobiae bacterium]|nr:CvpA family protein [Verrucomicrobiae bacterium]